MKYVLPLILFAVASVARADHYETRCVNGVCQQVLVRSEVPPAAKKLPQTAEPPLAAVPPSETFYLRTTLRVKVRSLLMSDRPVRLLLSRLFLRLR